MSQTPTIYRPFIVSSQVVSLTWVSAMMFDMHLKDRLLAFRRQDIKLNFYKNRALRHLNYRPVKVASDSQEPAVFDDYGQICKIASQRLDGLLFFWKNRQHLWRVSPKYGLELRMDISPYQSEAGLLRAIGNHISDTLEFLEVMERVMSPKQIKDLQGQSPFSRVSVAYKLAQAGGFYDFVAKAQLAEQSKHHVFNGLARRKERRSNILSFRPKSG